MSKDFLKYNSSKGIKKRTQLSEPSDSIYYSNLIGFSNKVPLNNKFIERDLGNGFKEIIPKNEMHSNL